MKYALEDLKQVKQLREDTAERKLARRKHEKKLAEKEVRNARNRLTGYRRFRKEKEAALFQAVKGKKIGCRELDTFKMEERFLAENERALTEELARSLKALEAAGRKAADALAVYQRKARDNRKMSAHKKKVLEAMAVEEDRKSEMEIEELYRGSGR